MRRSHSRYFCGVWLVFSRPKWAAIPYPGKYITGNQRIQAGSDLTKSLELKRLVVACVQNQVGCPPKTRLQEDIPKPIENKTLLTLLFPSSNTATCSFTIWLAVAESIQLALYDCVSSRLNMFQEVKQLSWKLQEHSFERQELDFSPNRFTCGVLS